MSNQSRGDKGNQNSFPRLRGGSRPRGSFGRGRPFPNEQRNEEDDKSRQNFYPENRDASGSQSSGFFDNKSRKSGNDNRSENRFKRDSEPWNSSGKNRDKARAFNMSNDSNSEKECDEQPSPKDAIRDRVMSNVNLNRSMESAEGSKDKVKLDSNDSEKLSRSSSTSETHSVKTGSGVFECSGNLTPENNSRRSGSNNSKNRDKKKENQKKGRNSRGQSCITEIDGDLFDAPDDVSLAHCVGADLRMGSGIAVRFWEKFKSVGKLFDQRVGPGGVASIRNGQRHVFYLITKQESKDKPTKETMRQSLLALLEKCKKFRVTKLAMPQIGCGLDGLEWNDVKQMLEEIFTDNFVITIYKLDKEFVNTPKSGFKTLVENYDIMLKDIDAGTGLLYIGYEQPFETQEMRSINEKYPFLQRLKYPSHKLGRTFWTKVHKEDMVYGLGCKKSADTPLSYQSLETALEQLKEFNKTHGYVYFGIQAFVEKDDPYVMNKIDTLFRSSLIPNVTFCICWPPALSHMRPSNSEAQYPSTVDDRSESSSHPSNSAERSEKSKNTKSPVNVQNKWDDNKKYTRSGDQTVEEVAEKMDAQSLADGSKLDSSTFDPNCSEATNDASNTTNMEWCDDSLLAQLPEPLDTSNNIPEEGWPDEYGKYHEEDERRKSNEKKQAKQLDKERERQERNSVKPKSCVTECKGDLFDAEDTICLAHCVGADFRMGSGIAILFRNNFGSVPELLEQRVKQGNVAYIEHGKRYIFYLVTKTESTGKPTYDTLERSLFALRNKCKELNVTKLAMPRIGCGLDRLEWTTVRKMLEEIFADGFAIQVYNLEKDYQETKKSMPKTTIKNEALELKDIAPQTGLLYIANEEQAITEEMKSLDEKYRFLQRLDKTKPKLGTVVRTEASYPREVVYGLVCKRSPNDPVNYVHLRAALKQLRTMNNSDRYTYFGIQAFEERGDDNIMGKVETLLRFSYIEAEVWICFPPPLVRLMPSSSSPSYNWNSSSGGRNPGEMTGQQMASTMRENQRTQEAIYRKLLVLEDRLAEISGPHGLKPAVNKMSMQINAVVKEMQETSSKTDNLIQEVYRFHESHENLEKRVTALENTKNDSEELKDLKERFESLEQQILFTHDYSAQDLSYNINGGYPRHSVSDGPPPLLPGPGIRPMYPSATDYCGRGMYHSGYSNNLQVYASNQLPEEKYALLRAANQSAEKNGLEITIDQGFIYMRKKKSGENFRRISNHGDLRLLEES